MATIREIANLAGVSRGTVDRVLNHRGAVKPETANKVMEIAKALEYKPNKAGMVLAAKKKKYRIGVVLFGEKNPFFDKVMDGVKKRALELEEYGFTVITKRVEFDVNEQLKAIDDLVENGIHGLLLAPYNHLSVKDKINELTEKEIPVITVNTDIEGTRRIAYVGSDFYQGGRVAAGLFRLIAKEGASLAILTGASEILCHTERIRGLREAMDESNSRIQVVEIVENHGDEIESYNLVKHLLKKYPELDAVFFAAAGVYGGCKAIEESGKNMKVITFDELPMTIEMLKRDVISATIGQQAVRQGEVAMSIMFEYLSSGTQPEKEKCFMDLTIHIKESV